MKEYLGIKKIKASTEMSREEYCNYRGWKLPDNENGEDRVYLVEYEVEDNSKPNHPNHEGYISMSPKTVFEKAYKEVKSLQLFDNSHFANHQVRVYEEAVELDTKCKALTAFIESSSIFKVLDINEQNRLKQQLMAMTYYLTILIERMENF